MKKILVILTCLVLYACTYTYHKLGYSDTQVSVINSLNEKNRVFFDEYSTDKALLLESNNFNEENLDLYILFIKYVPGDKVVDLVNKGLINKTNYGLVKRLANNKDFDSDKLEEYLLKLKTIKDENTAIRIVNEDIEGNTYLINNLSSDDYYIVNNLEKYIKYYDDAKTIRENIEYVNTLNYLTYYKDDIYAEPDKYGALVNVNKFYYLGEDYNPKDLVELDLYGYGSLRKIAYDAYVKMYEAAKKDNISFYVTSAYRSYDKQVTLYNNYLKTDPQEKVDIYSARPGFSDHQSGYTVDILESGYDFDTFYKSDSSKWLLENAYKFGFICRYPEGKESITGYEYEPWHYRYVGEDAATYIYKNKITYDEFFEVFVKE